MIPISLVQGTSASWTVGNSEYKPEDGWTAQYVFASPADTQTLDGTDNGDSSFLFELTSAASAEFEATQYNWQLFMEKGTERFLINNSIIEIRQDFGTSLHGADSRSHVKKTLDALEAMLEKKATRDQASFSIKNRSLSRMDSAELLDWYRQYRLWYKQELKAEKLKQGGRQALIRVRFSQT